MKPDDLIYDAIPEWSHLGISDPAQQESLMKLARKFANQNVQIANSKPSSMIRTTDDGSQEEIKNEAVSESRTSRPRDFESPGQSIRETTTTYVVASYGPEKPRYSMNKDFSILVRRGESPVEPRFYRSTLTEIETIEEISEDEWFATRDRGELDITRTV